MNNMKLIALLCLLATTFYGSHGTKSVAQYQGEMSKRQTAIGFALYPNMTLWEQLLVPSPTVVSLIGQMIVHSSQVAVSLEAQPPTGGWKHVNHPDSLRSALLQVGNDGWDAFNKAHTNMDHVAVSMSQVPRFVKMSLKIISRMPPAKIVRMMKTPLKHIRRIGMKAVALTTETTKAFVDVMGLTAELTESVGYKQEKTDELLVENEAKQLAAKTTQAAMKEQQKKMEERYKEQTAIVNKARSRYETAIKKIPTGFKAMAMEMFQTFAPTIIGGLMGVPIPPRRGSGTVSGPSGSSSQPQVQTPTTYDPIILKSIEKLSKRMPQLEEAIKQAKDSETGDIDVFVAFQHVLDMFKGTMENFPETGIKDKAIKMMDRLEEISKFMEEKLGDLGTIDAEEADGVLQAFDGIGKGIKELLSAGVATGATVGVTGNVGGGGQQNFGSGVGANERYKANMELQNLKNQEARQDALFRSLMDFNKELIAIEVEMKNLMSTGVNLTNIRELLRKVLVILGRIRELWSNLVEYFQIVAVRAKVINDSYLKVFTEMSEESADILSEGEDRDMRQLLLDELAEQAMDIQIVAHYLQTLCRTYVRISSQHILGRLAGVAKLLAANTDAERTQLLEKLNKDADLARQGIINIIKETREAYENRLEDRKEELQETIDNLGGVTQEEIEEANNGIDLAENNTIKDQTEEDEEDDWDLSSFLEDDD